MFVLTLCVCDFLALFCQKGEKPIIFFVEMDTGPFHIQVNYMEPMQVMMIEASIGTSKVSTLLCEEEVNHALREFEKEEEPVFPQAGKSLVDFLSKK
ncbi:hypothetical protein JHK84_044963 [Glycine max]|nr:hypothetical protein JHK84_044963 [Glycine max]